jgi:molybdate transport system substrate-binding protein
MSSDLSRLLGLVLLGLLAAGCQPAGDWQTEGQTTAGGGGRLRESPRLLLYCGAGIRPAANEIVHAFEREHGVTVECDYDGSDRLLSRIKLSRLGDVYMPGDVHYVRQAKEQGLLDAYRNACYFIPVILVQEGNPKNIQSLADLARPGIDVGLGNPETCAIGRRSAALFQRAGLSLEDVRENVKFQSVTVNELGNQIKLDQLDAVIVWDAMAAYFAGDSELVPIPFEQNVISTVAVGVLHSSRHPEVAQQLVDFIVSEQGKAIFHKHDYTTELPEREAVPE